MDQKLLHVITYLILDSCSVNSSSSVGNLGVLFDSNLSFEKPVSSICKTAFSSLKYIYANISLFLSYSKVTVATQIQTVSRSDGGSAPKDDLYSPERQRRPGQLDEPQR